MNKCDGLLTWQGFYGLIRGMQGVDRGSLVLEGYPGPIWAPVTVNQDLVTVLCLDEGPSLGVDVEVNEFLKAPLVGFTVETWDQSHLGGILLIEELWALDEATFRDWTGEGRGEEAVGAVTKVILEVKDEFLAANQFCHQVRDGEVSCGDRNKSSWQNWCFSGALTCSCWQAMQVPYVLFSGTFHPIYSVFQSRPFSATNYS